MCAGAGKTSSRYSTIALDSVSQKSPWASAGTLPVKARSRYALARCSPAGSEISVRVKGRPFSRSATKHENTYGLIQKESP